MKLTSKLGIALNMNGATLQLVEGFTTALLNMNLGDRWEVYIPYQLGYGEEDKNPIPGYSTLIFDINLVGIYRLGTSAPDWNAKPNDMWEME